MFGKIKTCIITKLTRTLYTGKFCHGRTLCLALVLTVILFPGGTIASSIKVTWDPAQVRRGFVVPIKVHSPVELMAAEAATGSDRFPLIKIQGDTYTALIGIDVMIQAPYVAVDFALFPAKGGPPYRIRADLKIRDSVSKITKVQKLSLPTGMVDLSQKRTEQVQEDNRTLGDILATRSRQRYWSEDFLLPVQGRITTKFGTRRILNGKSRSPHSGVDLAGKKGTPVKVSNSGKVLLVDDFYLSGKTVVVDHGWGVSTIYAHLDRTSIREGQEVIKGQILGTVGATGRATGPHLHFGAFIRGAKVDPLKLLDATKSLGMQEPGAGNQ